MNNQTTYDLAGDVFDYKTRTITYENGTSQTLTKREADLLLMLCENKNYTTKRSQALIQLWGSDNYFCSRSMDVFITRLRKYLYGNPAVSIENIRGIGFRLNIKSKKQAEKQKN